MWAYILPGAKLFVSLKSIYEGLQLSQFGGRPWRWYASGYAKWAQQLEEIGLGEHIMQGAEAWICVLANFFSIADK